MNTLLQRNDCASLPLPISSRASANLALEEFPVSYQADNALKQHSTGSLVILLILSIFSMLSPNVIASCCHELLTAVDML